MATVMVYSDDPAVRDRVRLAIGRTPDPALGPLTWLDVADSPTLRQHVGDADLLILDGEARPAGGMGIARELKAELPGGPPTLLMIARPDDRWLARWSLADAVVTMPLDPREITERALTLLRARLSTRIGPTAEGGRSALEPGAAH